MSMLMRNILSMGHPPCSKPYICIFCYLPDPMLPPRLREYENFHIVLWLMKDTCWVMDLKLMGLIMILPTVAVAIHITWISRSQLSEFFHNLAVVLWICANSVWMIGEFFYQDTLRPYAMIFFTLGLIAVAVYYMILRPRHKRRIRELNMGGNSPANESV